MRRTPTTLAVARELLKGEPDQPRWSYEVASAIEADRGTVSSILTRMACRGWLAGRWEDVAQVSLRRRPRHLYQVTQDGTTGLARLVDGRNNDGSIGTVAEN
jgi:DNA-binding PadR family transcriptional regulator